MEYFCVWSCIVAFSSILKLFQGVAFLVLAHESCVGVGLHLVFEENAENPNISFQTYISFIYITKNII